MHVFNYLRKLLIRHFLELRWQTFVLVIAAYFFISWVLLRLSGEAAITELSVFFYWMMVTASTVGYGDFSPTTVAGRYAVSLFVIPVGLSLFGLAVGRIAAFISFQWHRGVKGLKTLHYQDHIVVIGWNGARTLQLLRLLLREMEHQDKPKNIVLCIRVDIENPLPNDIGFVRAESFTSDSDMERASIDKAATIIIDNPDDDITLTTALYCHSKNPTAHSIAYFSEESLGLLLNKHCPNVECLPSVAVEMMAKAAVDPGSSFLHHELLNVDKGMTQYSLRFNFERELSVEDLFLYLKRSFDATLIAIADPSNWQISLNPKLNEQVKPGYVIYYIADERIQFIDWSGINVQ